jgi:hypothetical protein
MRNSQSSLLTASLPADDLHMPVPASKATLTLSADIPHLHTDYWCIQQRPLNQIISACKAPKGGIFWNEERMRNVVIVASSE